MKTAIYQYWDGPDTPGNTAGSQAMEQYADVIGADYIYEYNPKFVTNLGKYSAYYGAFKPVYDDRFAQYDYVMFADTDVFPREGLTEGIFDQFVDTDVEIGICEEWYQPQFRLKHTVAGINNANDEKWLALMNGKYGAVLPRTPEGYPRVFNSGVVVYSRAGLDKAKEKFVPFKSYVKAIQLAGLPPFYTSDQPYLHAMLEACGFNWEVMDYRWNSSVHFLPGNDKPRKVNDLRDPEDTNFVHIQLGGADHFDSNKLHTITNKSVDQWQLP